jgi:glycerol uptake facilitator-like aquaporin
VVYDSFPLEKVNQFFSHYKYIMYKYLAEFLGALFLMYVIAATGNPLAAGAALALAMLMTTNISGGHINPAVTIAMAAAGKLEVNEIIPYVLSQVFGALVAIQVYARFKL